MAGMGQGPTSVDAQERHWRELALDQAIRFHSLSRSKADDVGVLATAELFRAFYADEIDFSDEPEAPESEDQADECECGEEHVEMPLDVALAVALLTRGKGE